mgnify:FL=1
MPLLTTTGAASARGFGRGGGKKIFGVSYLVIAGGGAGGGQNPNQYGGGGAGGFRISYDSPLNASSAIDVTVGEPLSVTVGAGGPAVFSNYGPGNTPAGGKGSPSSFSTITSTGGGSAGGDSGSAPNGGSGAGTKSSSPVSNGNEGGFTPPEGNPGGYSNNTFPKYISGGGGGAGNAGSNSGSNTGGPGGDGLASSITGSPVTRGGGGGGGSFAYGSYGPGGSGGPGGGGGTPLGNGTANTGGGGGGCHGPNQPAGSTGGSGVVILRYTTSDAPSNVTGGTKTTSGSDTIHTFNSSGTLTVAD